MKQLKRTILTLVALLALTAQAWADEQSESFTTATNGQTTYTGEHFTITGQYANEDGLWITGQNASQENAANTVTISSNNGENITRIEAVIGYIDSGCALASTSGNVTGTYASEQTITISSVNATTVTLSSTTNDGKVLLFKSWTIYYGSAAPTTVTFTRGTGDKANEWTMVGGMPAGNVRVNVEYWPGMLTLPAASEGGTVTLEGVTINTIIDENFDDYTVGGKMAQTANAAGNSNWTTWSNAPGSGEDGTLATLNDNTCLQVIKDNDQVLLLGDKTSGMWEYSFDVYVPEGKFGYFNLLHDFDGDDSTWAFQCYLNANWEYDGENTSITYSPGHGTVHAGSESTADLPCVVNEWMHVSIVIDIDNDLAKLFFNGDFICEWQWSLESYGEDVIGGKLAACDFFGEGDEYYVDNIKFTQISLPAGFERDGYGNIYVESGTQINLVATPAENYHLASLSDGTNTYNVDDDGKVTITMPDADLTLTAEFAENTYNVTFNAANANTIENGKATVTVGGTAATVTEGKLEGVKMGSEVKMTAKQGYKFRKVEAKKVAPTLAETLTTAGMTVKVNYNYGGENYCTFVSNGDGTYTFQSGGGYVGGNDNQAKALVVENGKLVFKQDYSGYWESYGFSVTFDTSNNTYSQWLGYAVESSFHPSFISVEVNGTQIAVTQQ